MKKMLNLLLFILLVIFSLRITSLETKITELEKDMINRTHNNSHRMQDFENYIDFLKREYEPYIQEEKMKNLNERL